jgi:hypothetical protein
LLHEAARADLGLSALPASWPRSQERHPGSVSPASTAPLSPCPATEWTPCATPRAGADRLPGDAAA